jgi:hypothetical protein
MKSGLVMLRKHQYCSEVSGEGSSVPACPECKGYPTDKRLTKGKKELPGKGHKANCKWYAAMTQGYNDFLREITDECESNDILLGLLQPDIERLISLLGRVKEETGVDQIGTKRRKRSPKPVAT